MRIKSDSNSNIYAHHANTHPPTWMNPSRCLRDDAVADMDGSLQRRQRQNPPLVPCMGMPLWLPAPSLPSKHIKSTDTVFCFHLCISRCSHDARMQSPQEITDDKCV